MQIKSSYEFPAPPERVWDLLMDTQAIAACLPGCRELRDLGEDRYQAELAVSLAAITGNYGATVGILDKLPPHSYRLVVQGSGRSGFIKGQALVTLQPSAAGTAVAVDAQTEVGGLIARMGQRLLDSAARTMMGQFFTCLGKRL